MPTYYTDTENFADATGIWTDVNLTTKAPNGFYKKDGVYRQMSGGELLTVQNCPECFYSFESSLVAIDSETACGLEITETYYFDNVDGAVGEAEPEVGDLVYSDITGTTPLAAGFYKLLSGGYIQVDSSGEVIAVGNCVTPPDISVQSVGGFMEPCSGGAIDDYMGAIVVLDAPADVDSQFVVEVYYVETGGTCGGTQFFETFNVDILEGDDISNFNACSQGVLFPTGAVICGACIVSCDNPNITIGAFQCPS